MKPGFIVVLGKCISGLPMKCVECIHWVFTWGDPQPCVI